MIKAADMAGGRIFTVFCLPAPEKVCLISTNQVHDRQKESGEHLLWPL
jgi:hypothetical protein